jgi:SulP family sulfate permease
LPAVPTPDRIRIEVVAGLVVALALIPEAISFSIITGVDPKVGLYASFTMAVTIAFAGGRPAMISAATGAMALVAAPLMKAHGLQFLFAAGLLAGVFQIALGVLRVPRLMRFVPRSVMTGFVNALAILIFLAQVPHLKSGGWLGGVFVVIALAIMFVVPRLTRAVPAPLIAIAVLTFVVLAFGVSIRDVHDEGALPDALPGFGIPDVPLSLETLKIIAPYSLALSVVGLLESLMTATLVDDITETRSDKNREARGQGMANVVTAFFGGMPGCAMIGQTMINVRTSGARTRLSTFCAGFFLLVLCVALGDLVGKIPMAALVAVMILVSVSTFDWHSIRPRTLKRMPVSETVVMGVTVAGTVATGDLAIGVGLGVLCAMIAFARRVAHMVEVERIVDPDGTSVVYAVSGELFFASDRELVEAFDYAGDPPRVLVDLSRAHLWDTSAVAALDAIEQHYARHGTTVEVTGLNARSAQLRAAHSGRALAG